MLGSFLRKVELLGLLGLSMKETRRSTIVKELEVSSVETLNATMVVRFRFRMTGRIALWSTAKIGVAQTTRR